MIAIFMSVVHCIIISIHDVGAAVAVRGSGGDGVSGGYVNFLIVVQV